MELCFETVFSFGLCPDLFRILLQYSCFWGWYWCPVHFPSLWFGLYLHLLVSLNVRTIYTYNGFGNSLQFWATISLVWNLISIFGFMIDNLWFVICLQYFCFSDGNDGVEIPLQALPDNWSLPRKDNKVLTWWLLVFKNLMFW